MKQILATIILLVLTTIASAASLGTDAAHQAGFNDLAETDKAEIIKTIADRKAAQATAASQQSTPQKVNEWLDIGSRIGQGMAGAAKEMGVAVNDFAKTPVGIWTIAMITWKFMGGVVLHFFGAIVIWFTGFSFIWWVTRKRDHVTMQYDPEKKDLFGRSRLISVVKGKLDDDSYAGTIIMGFVVLVAGLITMFTY